MTDEAEAGEPALTVPDPEWLKQQVKLAISMGITETEDIRALLEGFNSEELRSNFERVRERMTEMLTGWQSRLIPLFDAVIALADEPLRIAELHAKAQKAMLRALIKAADEATPDQLANLMVTYSELPEPYSQEFYRPWPFNMPPQIDESSADG